MRRPCFNKTFPSCFSGGGTICFRVRSGFLVVEGTVHWSGTKEMPVR